MLGEEEKESLIKDTNREEKASFFSFRRLIVFLVGFISGTFIIPLIIQIIVISINRDYVNKESPLYVEGMTIINSFRYAVLTIVLLCLLIPLLKEGVKRFKNWKNILYGVGFGAAIIGLTIFYNLIISAFVEIPPNGNEALSRSMIKDYPIITVFVVGLLGPFCEEIIYRYGLFGFINQKFKILAYIVTILVFAFIHFDYTGDLFVEFLNLPVYILAGIILTFAYDRFGLESSLTAHVINNMYAVVIVLLAQ